MVCRRVRRWNLHDPSGHSNRPPRPTIENENEIKVNDIEINWCTAVNDLLRAEEEEEEEVD